MRMHTLMNRGAAQREKRWYTGTRAKVIIYDLACPIKSHVNRGRIWRRRNSWASLAQTGKVTPKLHQLRTTSRPFANPGRA